MTSLLRGGARAALVTLGLGVLTALAGPASAHVTVQPAQAPAGSYTVVSFRVPTERDDASTTKVTVVFPEDQPVASVRTTPVPGWTVRTATRTLDTPLDQHGTQIDQVVSKVTWTADSDGIRPGEFEDFPVSLGPLPDSGNLVFRTFQTYDDGQVVAWNEVSVDASVEPEHPAPTLTLVTSGEAGATESPSPSATDAPQARLGKSEAGASVGEGNGGLALGVSIVALLLGGAALFTSLRRRSP
jgi:uncharacterized protein YcnI